MTNPRLYLILVALLAGCESPPIGPGEFGGRTVATVRVVAGDSVLESWPTQGETAPARAYAYDAAGEVIPRRHFEWSSSDPNVATVDALGRLTATGPGTATIRATERESRRAGALELTVIRSPVTGLWISPDTATVEVGGIRALTGISFSRFGQSSDLPVVWTSLDPAIAGVNDAGVVTGVQPGLARIAGMAEGGFGDTVTITSLGSTSLYSTAFHENGSPVAYGCTDVPSAWLRFPVRLDLARPSAVGDIGAVDVEFAYDSSLLRVDSVQRVASGSSMVDTARAGMVRYTLSATEPQGTGNVTLFIVTLSARPGRQGQSRIGLTYRSAPTRLSGTEYSLPLVRGSDVWVGECGPIW